MAVSWVQALALVKWGFVYSFFWSAMTVCYVLLRKSVDATPLEQVSRMIDDQDPEAIPISGIAAAEKREAESETSDSTTGD